MTVVMVIEKEEIGFAVVTIFPVLLCHMWCCQYMYVCVCILLAFLYFFPGDLSEIVSSELFYITNILNQSLFNATERESNVRSDIRSDDSTYILWPLDPTSGK